MADVTDVIERISYFGVASVTITELREVIAWLEIECEMRKASRATPTSGTEGGQGHG